MLGNFLAGCSEFLSLLHFFFLEELNKLGMAVFVNFALDIATPINQ